MGLRLKIEHEQSLLYYLLGTWKRTTEVASSICNPQDLETFEKCKILAEIKRFCVGYAASLLLEQKTSEFVPRIVVLTGETLRMLK